MKEKTTQSSLMLSLTKRLVILDCGVFFFYLSITLDHLLFMENYVPNLSNQTIDAWGVAYVLIALITIIFGVRVYDKSFVYDDSVLNDLSKKDIILMIIVGIISLLSVTVILFNIVYVYIFVPVSLLWFALQIYFYSKIKRPVYLSIAFSIILAVELFLVHNKNFLALALLISLLPLISVAIIYKNT